MKLLTLVILFSNWSQAADLIVAKSQFTETMKISIPNAFCAEKQYFRKCFKTSEDECIKEAVRAIKVCLASMEDEIPQKLHEPEDGKKWGQKTRQ